MFGLIPIILLAVIGVCSLATKVASSLFDVDRT